MLYKENPFTGYLIALVPGIICGYYLHSNVTCTLSLVVLTTLITVISFLHREKINSVLFGVLLYAFVFFAGCLLSEIENRMPAGISEGDHRFILQIDNYPKPRSRSLMLETTAVNIDGNCAGNDMKLVLYSDDDCITEGFIPGKIISLTCPAIEITDFDTTDTFDYKAYMNRKGYRYCLFCYDSINIIDNRPGLLHAGQRLRSKLIKRLDSSLNNPECLALVSAMTLGYREMLDSNIKEQFRKSGIIHIIAVSGLHVGIISGIIFYLIKLLRIRSRHIKLFLPIIIIWAYALITGLSPSVTRASVMFSFLVTGQSINRPAKPLNSVMASAFFLLVLDPGMLLEASFLLSYSAVIFIISYYNKLAAIVRFKGVILRTVWKMLVVSFLAWTGTLPFVSFFFGEIPVLSIVSNLFAIPLATIILVSGFLLIIISPVPVISGILAGILDYSVNTISGSAAAISLLNTVIQVGDMSAPAAVILFLLLFSVIGYLLEKENKKPHMVLFFGILYLIAR